MNIIDNFRIADEKENFETVTDNIQKGISFRGTNLWILIFAIFIASLGLNVNSTAVIIGAMLVSPLMGPIMGMGFGMAINDLSLLKKSLYSYFFAAVVGLSTSTIFFLISPINEAHSEILARTSPNIYDVLIALFGGLAGILATTSKLKGNVIPGVAIATALMPPLCTAGYGLATLQFPFFFGALYLYLINTVFIALATILTVRFLKFRYKILPKKEDQTRAKRIVWVVVLLTFLPSVYFGYDLVQQNKFEQNANQFIEFEAIFPNDYLLNKTIDAKKNSITLTYGGQIIEEAEIEKLRSKMPRYNLKKTTLTIQQGFSYITDNNKIDQKSNQLSIALSESEKQINAQQKIIDSLVDNSTLSQQVHRELKAQYPQIKSSTLQNATIYSDTSKRIAWISVINSNARWDAKDKIKIKNWLKVRIDAKELEVYFE
ncbi:MAG: TIGR00341 family protein [Crocinitomicaceae bacterium]|nr:TIGR00341 family protein [Crocinitomicaceae bacterium]